MPTLFTNMNNIRATYPYADPRHVAMSVHEAAHAVTAMHLGYHVSELAYWKSASEPSGIEGRCVWEKPLPPYSIEKEVHVGIVTTAAWAGQDDVDGAIQASLMGYSWWGPSGWDAIDLRALGGDP